MNSGREESRRGGSLLLLFLFLMRSDITLTLLDRGPERLTAVRWGESFSQAVTPVQWHHWLRRDQCFGHYLKVSTCSGMGGVCPCMKLWWFVLIILWSKWNSDDPVKTHRKTIYRQTQLVFDFLFFSLSSVSLGRSRQMASHHEPGSPAGFLCCLSGTVEFSSLILTQFRHVS